MEGEHRRRKLTTRDCGMHRPVGSSLAPTHQECGKASHPGTYQGTHNAACEHLVESGHMNTHSEHGAPRWRRTGAPGRDGTGRV